MAEKIPVFQNPQLPGETIYWKGNSTGVLLLHGFTATTAEVRLLAENLHKLGLTVSAPLLPGHGTTPQAMNRVKYDHWIGCAEGSYQELKDTCSKVVVGGESMGAILCLVLAERHPEISALLLYSPAIRVPNLKYSKFMKYFIPIKAKSNNDLSDTNWQGYTVHPMKAAHEFYRLQNHVLKNLADVTQPALILQGIYDRTIEPDCGQLIYNAIQSEDKLLRFMQESGHVMLLDKEIEMINFITIKFLEYADIL